jgi:hypothetical protein
LKAVVRKENFTKSIKEAVVIVVNARLSNSVIMEQVASI